MVDWKSEWKPLSIIIGAFLACFFLPVGTPRFDGAVGEALHLTKWYAQEHVLLCLVPAFFIAGGISVFVSQGSVMKYLGARANKVLAYGVASVSGTILAVCSCTVLPLFAGIYRMGAGLGPACAFLYAGPAISVLAIVLTARVLGLQIGLARGVAAVLFALIIGALMHALFWKEEESKAEAQAAMPVAEVIRPLWQNAVFFASLVVILVFANWGRPGEEAGLWWVIYSAKWWIAAGGGLAMAVCLVAWFGMPAWKVTAVVLAVCVVAGGWCALPDTWQTPLQAHRALVVFSVGSVGLGLITSTQEGEPSAWFSASWTLAKQILPLLLGGVLLSGLLLGRPGHEGLIPSEWVEGLVGGNSLAANLFASVFGMFMYFATLTEVPILEGLLGADMGRGPALALLLAGPALSLPSLLVIYKVVGGKKTLVFCLLTVVMSTLVGFIFGMIA